MDIDYSKFKKHTREITRVVDKITLTASKQIGFPRAFMDKNSLKSYDGVVLYWEPAARAIAVRFTNNGTESSKSISKLVKSQKYGSYVGAANFLSTNSINPKDYEHRYDYKEIEPDLIGADVDDKVFVFQLKDVRKEDAYDSSQ